jgi:alkaline phosphatase
VVEALLDWLAAQPPALAFAALAVLSSLENVFPPLPADVAVVFGAFIAQRARVSPYLLGTVCWLANVASCAAMYGYARSRGKRFFDRGWPRRLVPPAAVQALEEAYAHHGVWGIFLSRFLPGVRAAVMPFAGLLGMSPARALLPAALASAIWYALLVAAGTALGLNWQAARRLVDGANRLLGLMGLLAAVVLAYWVWRRSRPRR